MPTYDYECKSCGASFEIFQSMSDKPVSVCPDCGGDVRRLIGGGAGIIFKGSGFYVTDNKRKAASSTTSPSAGGASEKPESKPEAKKEPVASTAKES